MYSMVVLSDEIVILKDAEELFVLRRNDWDHAMELFANLNGGGGSE